MLQHHKDSLEIMKTYFQQQDGVLALVFGGSVAKGEERPDSDLDGMVIVTDEEYNRRKVNGPLAECVMDKCTYPEGYFDVKYFNMDYLRAAADRGSDPTRNSFIKARVLFSDPDKTPGLEDLIKKITTYPVHKKQERIQLFHSIMRMSGGYFFHDSIANNNPYLLNKSVFEVVYAGLRMLYAYNEVFFASHKRLIQYAGRLDKKPDRIIEMAEELTDKKDVASKDAFIDAILQFTDWGFDTNSYGATYVENLEQTWQETDANVYEL